MRRGNGDATRHVRPHVRPSRVAHCGSGRWRQHGVDAGTRTGTLTAHDDDDDADEASESEPLSEASESESSEPEADAYSDES